MKGSIFVGGIHPAVERRRIEHIFEKYGPMNRCELKRGYAFVDYDDQRDAEDAINREHGRVLKGIRIVVEWAKGAPGFEQNRKHSRPPPRDYRYDDRRRVESDYDRKSRRRRSYDSPLDKYRKKRSRRSPSRSRSRSRGKGSAERSPSSHARSPSPKSASSMSSRN